MTTEKKGKGKLASLTAGLITPPKSLAYVPPVDLPPTEFVSSGTDAPKPSADTDGIGQPPDAPPPADIPPDTPPSDAPKPDGDMASLSFKVPRDFASEWHEFSHRHGIKGSAMLRAMLDAAIAADDGKPDDAPDDAPPAENKSEPFISLSLKIRESLKAEWDEMVYLRREKGPKLLRAAMTALKRQDGWPPKR